MALTADQILDEVRRWPQRNISDLAERLAQTIHPTTPTVEAAWRKEARDRIAEIESGTVEGIPGEQVSERIRRIVGR